MGDSCKGDEDCDSGLVCVDEHYVRIGGVWTKEPQACARQGAANQATFVEEPLDLGTVTVTGRRIEPPTFRIFQWSPPPPPPLSTLPWAPPATPPPPKEEEEEDYSFGTCSRMLGGSYWQPPPNTPNWVRELVQNAISANSFRHDDVIWGKKNDSPLGAAYQGAGLFPAAAYEAQAFDPQVTFSHLSSQFPPMPVFKVEYPTVPGWIKPLSPIPLGCSSFEISEQQHQNVTNRVDADRANPPDYNLRGFDQCGTGYNCQDWARKIENVARGL